MLIVFLELNDDVEDRDAFWSKFKHGLQAFKASLPSGVLALQAVDDIADTSALLITMESKQKTYRELNTYIDRLKDRLRRIDAISNLRTYGLENEQISIYLDQNKLAKYGIGSYKVLNQLALQGFTTMSGNLELGNLNLPIHITDSYNNGRCGRTDCLFRPQGQHRAPGILPRSERISQIEQIHQEQRQQMRAPLHRDATGN